MKKIYIYLNYKGFGYSDDEDKINQVDKNKEFGGSSTRMVSELFVYNSLCSLLCIYLHNIHNICIMFKT